MDSPASPFPSRLRTGASICKYRSISKSGRIPPWHRDEKTQKSVEQSHGGAAGGAEFGNCAGRHARHPRQAETAAETQEAFARSRARPNLIRVFSYTSYIISSRSL